MRYFYNRKRTVEESCDLNITKLKKRGMLSKEESATRITWTSSMRGTETSVIVGVYLEEDPFILLMYSITDRDGNKTDYKYAVSLLTTDCNLGGVRYWFACPACWQRVGVIYLAPGGTYFECRHCNNLTYLSRTVCNTTKFGIASREADRLRSELKRWTYRGRPTRKVRQLRKVEARANKYGGFAMVHIDNLRARIEKHNS